MTALRTATNGDAGEAWKPAPRTPGFRFARLLLRMVRRPLIRRMEDVREVLEQDGRRPDTPGAFSVREYGRRMKATTGAFFLGMDPEPGSEHDRRLLEAAFRSGDLGSMRRVARDEADKVVDCQRRHRSIDAVGDLASVVPVAVVEQCFGLPDPDRRILRQCQTFSLYIFLSIPPSRLLRPRAVKAATKLRTHVSSVIGARLGPGGHVLGPDDVLGRLLRAGASREDACRNLIGLTAGALVPNVGLFANVVDRFLALPAKDRANLQAAARAAGQGDEGPLLAYLREAGRFNPSPPMVYREALRDYVVARGTERERRIPEGRRVVVSLVDAAFDPYVFEDPEEFRLDRPESAYLLFGHALHRCFGEDLAKAMHLEMARALFSLPGLRRARGRKGRLRTRPGAPRSLTLEFDA